MKIDFANLNRQYNLIKKDLLVNLKKLLESSQFILGEKVLELEEKLKTFVNSKYCIATSSGTDSLLLSLLAINVEKDDEIITTPFTFIATAEVISLLKAKPVFVDIDEITYNINPNLIENKISKKTKAIIAVNLFGQPADFDKINSIAQKHNLIVIEDAAQSFGAEYKGEKSCNLTDMGCTSFFPSKPLGCYGDGGAVFTNQKNIYEKLIVLRNHGEISKYNHKYIGLNARLDAIQAVILIEKLKIFKIEIEKRNNIAYSYMEKLKKINKIILPNIKENRTSVWAQFSIRAKNRDKLKLYLQDKGIPTAIHYPRPLHMQECFKYLGYKKDDFPVAEKISEEIISLPMNPYLKNEEIEYICEQIYKFYN